MSQPAIASEEHPEPAPDTAWTDFFVGDEGLGLIGRQVLAHLETPALDALSQTCRTLRRACREAAAEQVTALPMNRRRRAKKLRRYARAAEARAQDAAVAAASCLVVASRAQRRVDAEAAAAEARAPAPASVRAAFYPPHWLSLQARARAALQPPYLDEPMPRLSRHAREALTEVLRDDAKLRHAARLRATADVFRQPRLDGHTAAVIGALHVLRNYDPLGKAPPVGLILGERVAGAS